MPAGVLPGHTITFAGKGAQHPGQLDGNLRVVAVQLPHARFEREGKETAPLSRCALMTVASNSNYCCGCTLYSSGMVQNDHHCSVCAHDNSLE